MNKIILLLIILVFGTSCQVYKKNHVGGYTFKWKPIEKKHQQSKNTANKPVEIYSDNEVQNHIFRPLSFNLAQFAPFSPAFNYDLPKVDVTDIPDNSLVALSFLESEQKDPQSLLDFISSEGDFSLFNPQGDFNIKEIKYKKASGPPHPTGVFGFVFSLIGFICLFIPIYSLGFFLFTVGMIIAGLISSIIGLTKGGSKAFAIAGLVLSILSILVLLILIFLVVALFATL
jgi:hypothetical protein